MEAGKFGAFLQGTPNAESLVMHELLGGEDASWLHMENAENPMVINALLEMGGVVDLELIRDLVRERALRPGDSNRA